jgi:hypothetical protein
VTSLCEVSSSTRKTEHQREASQVDDRYHEQNGTQSNSNDDKGSAIDSAGKTAERPNCSLTGQGGYQEVQSTPPTNTTSSSSTTWASSLDTTRVGSATEAPEMQACMLSHQLHALHYQPEGTSQTGTDKGKRPRKGTNHPLSEDQKQVGRKEPQANNWSQYHPPTVRSKDQIGSDNSGQPE